MPTKRQRQLNLLSTEQASHLETERDFQQRVVEYARIKGWLVYSIPDSRRATLSGYPDLTLIRGFDRRLVFAELKRDKGRLSDAQENVLETLRRIGRFEVYVWRPRDWDDVVRILA